MTDFVNLLCELAKGGQGTESEEKETWLKPEHKS